MAAALAATNVTGEVLVEAEAFKVKGGWVIDQQFMDEMGSPYLLAHGLSVPVEDASTHLKFEKTGTYHVWVRTRDWVAPWKTPGTAPARKAEGTPGKFEVHIDGNPLGTVFGTEGAEWHWQDGGTVEISRNEVALTLHDLTGFEGRCDAICFSMDPKFIPPNTLKAMDPWRRKCLGFPEKPTDAGEFDLVVVGGGIAGICAAVSAARNDVKVAFIHDRPVLGGNNSSEVRVWLGGKTHGSLYPNLGDVVKELEQEKKGHYGEENAAENYEDGRKDALVRAEANIAFFPSHRGNGVEMNKGRIAAVIAENIETGERLRFGARWVADCTGDGCIGALARADFDITLTGHMGGCNLWNTRDTGKPSPFPACPWALNLSDKPFPGRGEDEGQYTEKGLKSLGCWFWESGFDHDPIKSREYIRDWNFRAMYGAWDALKNTDKQYPNRALNWAAHISGPRESRRLLGHVVLTEDDVIKNRVFDDACVMTGWSIDLHYPKKPFDKGFEGDAFISYAVHKQAGHTYWMPYRMLYSRNLGNLFMAGRDVSVTHEALGVARIMRTGGLMGEVVGLAATFCKMHNVDPNDVYEKHLDEFKKLMSRGVNKSARGD